MLYLFLRRVPKNKLKTFVVLVLLLLSIPAGIILLQRSQDWREKALGNLAESGDLRSNIGAGKKGDANGDGHVTALDLGIIIEAYDTEVPNARADLNKDGRVSAADLGEVVEHYGE